VAAVEFAIVLPLLAVILLGILDFALLFYNKQVLTNASRELARFAIVEDNRENDADPNIADQIEYIKDFCSSRLINLGGANEMVIEPEFDPSDFSSDYITAIVRYEYNHLFSSITRFNSTTLSGRTVMRKE
jgi:Flp pilus assembly protein TadG